jgi:hypothetical protein
MGGAQLTWAGPKLMNHCIADAPERAAVCQQRSAGAVRVRRVRAGARWCRR